MNYFLEEDDLNYIEQLPTKEEKRNTMKEKAKEEVKKLAKASRPYAIGAGSTLALVGAYNIGKRKSKKRKLLEDLYFYQNICEEYNITPDNMEMYCYYENVNNDINSSYKKYLNNCEMMNLSPFLFEEYVELRENIIKGLNVASYRPVAINEKKVEYENELITKARYNKYKEKAIEKGNKPLSLDEWILRDRRNKKLKKVAKIAAKTAAVGGLGIYGVRKIKKSKVGQNIGRTVNNTGEILNNVADASESAKNASRQFNRVLNKVSKPGGAIIGKIFKRNKQRSTAPVTSTTESYDDSEDYP